jgi:hypothetical protein
MIPLLHKLTRSFFLAADIFEKRLDDLLFMNGLVRKRVPADGNCFFQSALPHIHSLLTVQQL